MAVPRFAGFRALGEHSLTGGLRVGPLYDLLLTTFVPGAIGYSFELIPHTLIFLYGLNGSLVPWPPTPGALYEPRLLGEHGVDWLEALGH